MFIQKKRIRSLDQYLAHVPHGTIVVPCAPLTPEGSVSAGFGAEPSIGDTILPSPVGPVSLFNAEGSSTPDKTKPKETVWVPIEWHWIEMHGKTEVPKSDVRYRSYQRYPRVFTPPPSVELTVVSLGANGAVHAVAPEHVWNGDPDPQLLHKINLMLDLFGGCEILTADLEPAQLPRPRRLNWEILPEGAYPWPRLREIVDPIIEHRSQGTRTVIRSHFKRINSFGPEFTAVGRAGFSGYIVFGFPDKNLYVLESMYYGNATYFFGDDWETLARRTKAEILDGHHELAREVHTKNWAQRVGALINTGNAAAA